MRNQLFLQGFEWYLPEDGKHWERLRKQIPFFQKIGVTGIWLPPAYKAWNGMHNVGYGTYDLYDLGEFDQKGSIPTKYGTKEEYLKLLHALKEAGICSFADIVFNQKCGADEQETVMAAPCSSSDRLEETGGYAPHQFWTKFLFPGRKGRYSDFQWDSSCFDGAEDQGTIYQFQGHTWDPDVSSENGNYDYLLGDDLDFDQEKVCHELEQWGAWYMKLTDCDGVRLDALKHINGQYFQRWLDFAEAETGKKLQAIGEYWSADLKALQDYYDLNDHRIHLFDVPLHFHFVNASQGGGYYDMRNLLPDTMMSSAPEGAVTFVDNHDTQPGQSLQSYVMSWFREIAYAVILFREEGTPCVFYGDLYGIPHDQIAPMEHLPKMMKLRNDAAYGPQHDYLDDPDRIGWTREGDAEHPAGLAVLLSDGPGGEKTMYLGTQHAGMVYEDLLERNAPVMIDQNGNGTFDVQGGSAAIYTLRKTCAATKKPQE